MRRWMSGCAAIALATSASAQNAPRPIEYEVSFENAVHNEARITVTVSDLPMEPVRFQMSRSSPGRYAIHEFAKNVYSVSAKDGRGRDLPVIRTDPYGWTVARHDGTVAVTYTLFADRADGTYAQVDPTHAHLNMPATFLWAQGQDARPITVRFRPANNRWKVATQLVPTSRPWTFGARDLQYFMDSPTTLADHDIREWQVDDLGTPRTIRLAVHHNGAESEVDRFTDMAKKVVDEQIKVFGGDVPDFDHGEYTFIAAYVPQASGDGMEHRNSTILTTNRGLAEANYSQIGTLSHEFFHAWLVERLRPAELEPFDFTRANPTPSLWFAEGFTSYYGPLTIARAGVWSVDEYLADLSRALNYTLNRPGRRYHGPMEMSLRAPFVDAATAIDPRQDHIFTSYYLYGAVIAAGLDLALRQRGTTLDAYMQVLWRSHGVAERPFVTADLKAALATVTDRQFADTFFSTQIEGSQLPDFAPLLAQAGLVLRPANPGRGWVGPTPVRGEANGVTVAGYPAPGTPLYDAGVGAGARITALGGKPIASEGDWTSALAARKPGERVEIAFAHLGQERRATMTLAADPTLEVVRTEAIGGTLTPAQAKFRAGWLGGQP